MCCKDQLQSMLIQQATSWQRRWMWRRPLLTIHTGRVKHRESHSEDSQQMEQIHIQQTHRHLPSLFQLFWDQSCLHTERNSGIYTSDTTTKEYKQYKIKLNMDHSLFPTCQSHLIILSIHSFGLTNLYAFLALVYYLCYALEIKQLTIDHFRVYKQPRNNLPPTRNRRSCSLTKAIFSMCTLLNKGAQTNYRFRWCTRAPLAFNFTMGGRFFQGYDKTRKQSIYTLTVKKIV